MPRIVTHSGNFHADDVFAVATLSLYFDGDIEVERTRDKETIEAADIVVDVGGEYDPETKRFDHHQPGGAGERENGIPYAGFGLVWKHYGAEVAGSKEAQEHIDDTLVQAVDATDNGVDLCEQKTFEGVMPTSLNAVVGAFRPTWKEDVDTRFERFMQLVAWAKKLLERKVAHAQAGIEARAKVLEYYEQADDKRVVVMEQSLPWARTLTEKEEPLFVVYPKPESDEWRVQAVPVELGDFDNRADLPEAWAGKEGQELIDETGVETAVFCHRGLFLAVARTKEDVLEMVEIALEEQKG